MIVQKAICAVTKISFGENKNSVDSVLISNWKQKLSFMGVILKSLKTRQKFNSCLYCFLCSSYCKNDKKMYALTSSIGLAHEVYANLHFFI